jgi:hypothetical protein
VAHILLRLYVTINKNVGGLLVIKSFGWARLGLAAGLWLVAHAANAGLVTLVGGSINYVYDDSQVALELFGTPRIVGDGIAFRPGSFRAQSLNGAGSDTATAEFLFSSVYSRDGSALGGVGILEFGDYELIRGGSVGAELELTVRDNISGNSAAAGESFSDNVVLGSLQFWDMTVGLDAGSVFNAPTNDISLAIRNTLTASSGALAEGAWIQKKLAFATVINTGIPIGPNPPTEEVPAPGVLALFGLGLLTLGGVRRRSRPV